MGHFEKNDKYYKAVVKVTILSRNPFSGEEKLGELALATEQGDDVAQLKVIEHGELSPKEAIEELEGMGKTASALGIEA